MPDALDPDLVSAARRGLAASENEVDRSMAARPGCTHQFIVLRQDGRERWLEGATENGLAFKAGEEWHLRVVCSDCDKILAEHSVRVSDSATQESRSFLDKVGSQLLAYVRGTPITAYPLRGPK